MKCRICDRPVSSSDHLLCIWCELFIRMNMHGSYTFPDGKLTITDNYHTLPSVEKEDSEIKGLKNFNNPERNDT